MKKISFIQIIIKILIILISITGLYLFGNTFSRGICNIGNMTGSLLSIMLIVYGSLMGTINRFLINRWKIKIGRIVLIIVSGLAVCVFGLAVFAISCMISGARRTADDPSVIIVLGCQVRGNAPSLMLVERLEAAQEYLETHGDAVCIVSGGQGPGENISEAESMKDWLLRRGISGSRIFTEDESTNTDENIEFSKKLLNDYSMGNKVSIVTNDFHEYRALRIARKKGLDASAVPAETAWWLEPTFAVREMYAILEEVILK